MQEYHKIQSVYMRDPKTHHGTFLEGQWSVPELGYLAQCNWTGTEKVDGTNVRVQWDGTSVKFGGRTDDAQMPTTLLHRLGELFTPAKLRSVFHLDAVEGQQPPELILFGEGYGAKIQKGGERYIADKQSFVLFDILIGDVYLERHNVQDIAEKLGLELVPIVFHGTLLQAIELTRGGFKSKWGDFTAEGLVLRPDVELRTRSGHRIITKVKHRDFITK